MTKSAFPHWIYDGSPIEDTNGDGERAVQFLRRLRHPQSSDSKGRFQLYDFQERIVRRIYGPRDKKGNRIVKTVFLMLPRGNRKTSLAAALALLHLLGPEKRPAGQVIFAASDREQASIGFTEAVNIVREDPRLIGATRIYDGQTSIKKIINQGNNSFLQAVSSDGKAQHGKTPSFVLADEIHAWQGLDLWEALESGMVKVPNTLMVIATTAGRGQENIGFKQYEEARQVATCEKDNPHILPIIFEPEQGDGWQDEKVWHKVNPGMKHDFPVLDNFRAKAKSAMNSPSSQATFAQFNLNKWQSASRDPLFDMSVWDGLADANFYDDDLIDLEEFPCWLGVDMSRSGDLTAIVGAWRHKDGTVSVHPWFFLPSEGLEKKEEAEKVPYRRWRDDDCLNIIDGPVIEPDEIADFIINKIKARFDVQEVIFDPSLAAPVMARLEHEGIAVLQHKQTPINMHGPICDLERSVNGRKVRHGAHPILRNHLESVVVSVSNNSSEIKRMHKGTRNSNHIDGAIASALAIFRAVANDNTPSALAMEPEEYARLMFPDEAA